MNIEYYKISSECYSTFLSIIKQCAGELDKKLLTLAYLLISQINKCPYCVDVHFQECLKNEIDSRKINSILVFKNSNFFTKEEKSVLKLAEKITILDGNYKEEIENLKKFFTEKQISDIVFAISNMNSMNRIAIAFDREQNK
jgi:AhpD family alkylhydroperoxidase